MASHISDLIHDVTLLRETHSHITHQGGVYIYHTTLFLTIQIILNFILYIIQVYMYTNL
jgi:hypothetical protein